MTGTTMDPATTLTVMVVGDAAAIPMLRVKLMVPGIPPLVGETVNEPGGTPGVVTVDVYVPEPDRVLVPVWPHASTCDVGVTVKLVATTGGGASPAGPSTPITDDVSTKRFCASVTMSEPVPQPLSVTRKLPPLVLTIAGDTLRNCGSGDTIV